jgi:hypothetical protein
MRNPPSFLPKRPSLREDLVGVFVRAERLNIDMVEIYEERRECWMVVGQLWTKKHHVK